MKIHTVRLGVANVYILQDKHCIVIDTGAPRKENKFLKYLNKNGIKPQDIKLIVLTHGHYDHVGNAAFMQKLSSAPVAIHKNESSWCISGVQRLSPPANRWGFIFGVILKLMLPLNKFRTFKPDILLSNKMFNLKEYGIDAKLLHTPGHSSGSVSIILNSGEAFVGDLAMSAFPLRVSPGTPIFIENYSQLITSYRLLLQYGVSTVFPAHGAPFNINIIKKYL